MLDFIFSLARSVKQDLCFVFRSFRLVFQSLVPCQLVFCELQSCDGRPQIFGGDSVFVSRLARFCCVCCVVCDRLSSEKMAVCGAEARDAVWTESVGRTARSRRCAANPLRLSSLFSRHVRFVRDGMLEMSSVSIWSWFVSREEQLACVGIIFLLFLFLSGIFSSIFG